MSDDKIRKAIVIGGSNGIGLALAMRLSTDDRTHVTIIDKVAPAVDTPENECHDLRDGDE